LHSTSIRRVISDGNPVTSEIQNMKILEELVTVLKAWKNVNITLILETLWILMNIMVTTDGTSKCADYLL